MKSLSLFFTFLVVLICFQGCKFNTSKIETDKHQSYFHTHTKPIISAHRGGADIKGYPENSLEVIAHLYKQGINVFEVDVNQSADGKLFLFHDDFLEKHSTGNGKFSKLNSEDIQTLKLIDNFNTVTNYRLPYLTDVLEWGKDKDVYFMIDFKKNTSYKETIKQIQALGMQDKCVLISYSVDQAKKQHKLAPNMLLSISARNMDELERHLRTNIPTELMLAFTGTRLSNAELYERLDAEGIPAILGTLGNLDNRAAARGDNLYRDWADLGIDIFATNRPLEVYKAVQ